MTILSVFAFMLSGAQANPLHLIDTGNGHPFMATEAQMEQLTEKAHKQRRCGGFFDLTHVDPAQNKINQKSLPNVDAFTRALGTRPLSQAAYLSGAFSLLDGARITTTVKALAAYKNRYYQSEYGVQAANWIADQFRALGANRNDVKVELFQHSFKQPSVIATIAGTGPHKDEIVVVGGHEDSINVSAYINANEASAPGADDNATGIATVLEVYRVILQSGFKPDRTISFMTYAGEEKGLLGSQDIANKYKKDGKQVVSAVQFDMTGFNGSQDQVVFMTDYTNPELTQFTQKLMDTYVKSRWTTDQCGYACSDHASWNRAGYPSVMPFEAKMDEYNENIHSPKDLFEILDFTHSMHFTKLALSFVAELSAN